jgi:putative membrane protein
MIEFLKATVRGIVIGIANVIPGVSGGTMMVSMGVYDTIIGSITGLLKHFWKSVKTLLPYLLGALIGIVALASVIVFLFDNFPLPTATAFIGLILGGLAPLLKQIDMKKAGAGAVLLFIVFLALIVFLAIINPTETGDIVSFTWAQAGVLLFMGIIASATMIIPGVSGSMMLMLLGYYRTVIDAVSHLKDALLGGGLSAAVEPLKVLLPFAVGVVIGIYAVAKLIEWLLKRYPVYTYSAILGLVVASPVAVLLRCDMSGVTPVTVLISLVTFIAGFVFAAWMARMSEKDAKRVKNQE